MLVAGDEVQDGAGKGMGRGGFAGNLEGHGGVIAERRTQDIFEHVGSGSGVIAVIPADIQGHPIARERIKPARALVEVAFEVAVAVGGSAAGQHVPGVMAEAAGLEEDVLIGELVVKGLLETGIVEPVLALQAFRAVKVYHLDAAGIGDTGKMRGHFVEQ